MSYVHGLSMPYALIEFCPIPEPITVARSMDDMPAGFSYSESSSAIRGGVSPTQTKGQWMGELAPERKTIKVRVLLRKKEA